MKKKLVRLIGQFGVRAEKHTTIYGAYATLVGILSAGLIWTYLDLPTYGFFECFQSWRGILWALAAAGLASFFIVFLIILVPVSLYISGQLKRQA
ncbi:hypothetical protein [Candidatus Magnetobacterium casense]|uniref:Uncharacterized protein n=1 Tax=Candidatus Magnetobacterium casense TaxID=1455061 RepID=A0ABS6RX63_9BACT|nr:hypothetical protein [Candidatus Magnetobacterium casensis]MBV6341219.1 hypothetical protein [Candidatus Magnetobacterium casensis]